jgi:hypothetical protein
MADEKKPKVYKLRKYKVCVKCQKPLTSDKDEVCAPCGLAAAQEKEKPKVLSEVVREKGPSPEPVEAPEITTLDVMKEVLAEVERQNAEDTQIAEEVRKRFQITDMGSANWAAGKIAMWQTEIERRKAQGKEFVAEAERNVRRFKFLFMTSLEAWAKANIPHDKKSIKLPLATLKFSDTQEKIEIADEEKVVAWATVNCEDAVSMKAELQVLKDLWLKSDKKTVPDGCSVVPKDTIFKVE